MVLEVIETSTMSEMIGSPTITTTATKTEEDAVDTITTEGINEVEVVVTITTTTEDPIRITEA